MALPVAEPQGGGAFATRYTAGSAAPRRPPPGGGAEGTLAHNTVVRLCAETMRGLRGAASWFGREAGYPGEMAWAFDGGVRAQLATDAQATHTGG